MRRGAGFPNRNQPRPAGGHTKQTTQRGLFADGVWHCDCEPRLPAEHFRVKKEGRNQGRWFYTCQQAEPRRCPFFLWDDDARPREEAAVLNNSRTEPERVVGGKAVRDGGGVTAPGGVAKGQGLFAGAGGRRGQSDSSTASPSPEPAQAVELGPKRSAGAAALRNQDDEEFFPWPLTGEEEGEQEGSPSTLRSGSMETPRKARKTGVYATPATSVVKRQPPWAEQSPPGPRTPPAKDAEDPAVTPSKPPKSAAGPTARLDEHPTTPLAPPADTTAASPSPPPRHRDAFINPDDSSSSLAGQVLAVLCPVNRAPLLAQDVLTAVRAILTRHDLRTQGIVKGRDISRLALRAKDVRIAELQARIASLEAEREVDRAVIRSLRGG